jgi:hypothetical protein
MAAGRESSGTSDAAAHLAALEHKFYCIVMASPDPDHIRYAQIAAAAARHVQGWRFTAEEEAAANR